jgi:GntR family transcriptional regulator
VPLYRQIAAGLRAEILGGRLRPGDRLPTEPQLMASHGTSRNTVRLAVAALVNEGLVVMRPGRRGGAFVRDRAALTYHASRAEQPDGLVSEADAFFTETSAQGRQPTQEFSVHLEALDVGIATRLDVDEGSPAVVRRCLRSVDGTPSSTQDSYYPEWLVELVPDLRSPHDIRQGTTRLLAESGHLQVAFRDELGGRMPSPEEVEMLALSAGTPVIEYIRTAYTADRPVRVTRSIFAGDRNRIVYTLGDAEVLARLDTLP